MYIYNLYYTYIYTYKYVCAGDFNGRVKAPRIVIEFYEFAHDMLIFVREITYNVYVFLTELAHAAGNVLTVVWTMLFN